MAARALGLAAVLKADSRRADELAMTRTLLALVLLICFLLPTLIPAEALAGQQGYNRNSKAAERTRAYNKRRSEYNDRKKREAQEKAWRKKRDAQEEAWQKKSDARRARDEEYMRKRRRASGDDEEEEPDYRDRTSGGACMYGPDGKVIYRPRGARCRGDLPRGSNAEGPRSQLQPLESTPASPQPRSKPKSKRTKKTRDTGR